MTDYIQATPECKFEGSLSKPEDRLNSDRENHFSNGTRSRGSLPQNSPVSCRSLGHSFLSTEDEVMGYVELGWALCLLLGETEATVPLLALGELSFFVGDFEQTPNSCPGESKALAPA